MEPLLTTQAAADFLTLTKRTLETWRCKGIGPPYRKLGGAVRYAMVDLENFVAGAKRFRTGS